MNQSVYLLHRGAVADDILELADDLQFRAQTADFALERFFLEDAVHHEPDFIHIEWFVQVIGRAHFHRLHGGLGFRDGRDHHDRHRRGELQDLGKHFETIHLRHLHVEQYHVKWPILAQRLQTAGTALRQGHVVAVLQNEPH